MSWLLFMDESGHDHRTTPYEVRGGVAIHASRLWSFILAVRELEREAFGTYLHEHASEIKGSKLLNRERFRWAQQEQELDPVTRKKHALNFLNSHQQNRKPRRHEFTAFGQACISFAGDALRLLRDFDAKLFAAIIPRVAAPETQPAEYLRKDHVFLFERFFYFLEHKQETGLIVMDASEKQNDRRFVRQMERYFTLTQKGRQRTQWIVPSPFFVESDMAYGVQVSDIAIYCVNWGFRLKRMVEPTRSEIEPLAAGLQSLVWRGQGYDERDVFDTYSVVFVPDPYEPRSAQ